MEKPEETKPPAPKEKKPAGTAAGTSPGLKRFAAGKDEQEKPPTVKYMTEIVEFLRLAGQVVNTVNLYGLDHKLSQNALEACYKYLVPLLEKCPRINLSIANKEILVDGQPIGSRNPFVTMLANKLAELDLLGFSLLKNMPHEEFNKLFRLIVTPLISTEGDAFAEAVAREQLSFVQVEKVKYERVTEGDVVLSEGEIEELAAGGGKGEGEGEDIAPLVQQIIAFLKGDVTVTAKEASEGLEELSSDATQLAQLIMEAVAIRQRAAAAGGTGETLGDIVVGCLRRTFDGLMQHPAAKTQKGKKNIKKCLLMLEKNVLDKLHALQGEPDPEMDAAVVDAVEEMTDEVEIEGLTEEYMKRRDALEKTEKRVVRYMKRQQDLEATGLETRMVEAGLPPEGWQELLVRGGVDQPVMSPGVEMPGGVGALAVLLSELDRMMAASALDAKIAAEKAPEIDKESAKLSSATKQKIDKLSKSIKDEDKLLGEVEEPSRSRLKMSRRAMMELLAEIVQELCQSLSAINCAVGMTIAGHIGDINTEQHEVLGVAAKCGHRLDELLDRLIEIVGLPSGLSPDKESVYSSPPPQRRRQTVSPYGASGTPPPQAAAAPAAPKPATAGPAPAAAVKPIAPPPAAPGVSAAPPRTVAPPAPDARPSLRLATPPVEGGGTLSAPKPAAAPPKPPAPPAGPAANKPA